MVGTELGCREGTEEGCPVGLAEWVMTAVAEAGAAGTSAVMGVVAEDN